ncbi:MAG: glycoside hydrolase 43 family protein [Mangrovibacterium sp.]
MKLSIFLSLALLFSGRELAAQSWQSDMEDGTYKNPVLYADYSDPDVCRAGDDFYMTASSFNCAPGLPILHSKDMINWKLIGYALERQVPEDFFSVPRHGMGVWAPAIRFHKGEFYIYYPDPDFGIYMTKAADARGPWSDPVLVKEGRGWIDPCPLWDEDGRAYLVNAFAGSRAGIKSLLMVHEMNPDGTRLLGNGVMVFDGHGDHGTVEGPKFYKRNGYYYIFAPAGGVKPGWQLVLRSRNVFGPYEHKVVLHQGNTAVNGPHQGALIELDSGESWFYHFQDRNAYGRIVHLQPVSWVDDWPIPGTDTNGDGIGEPVDRHKKPALGKTWPVQLIPAGDEFNGHRFGLQWQWHANPQTGWGYMSGNLGFLRLNCVCQDESIRNLWEVPNLFLQKFPAPEFSAIVKLRFYPHQEGDRTGLLIMGEDYAWIGLEQKEGKLNMSMKTCLASNEGNPETTIKEESWETQDIYLRVEIDKDARCRFSYSKNGKKFISVNEVFQAKAGRWIGAKVGLFATSSRKTNDAGYVNADWFRVK